MQASMKQAADSQRKIMKEMWQGRYTREGKEHQTNYGSPSPTDDYYFHEGNACRKLPMFRLTRNVVH